MGRSRLHPRTRRLANVLARRARKGDVISYGALARAIGMIPRNIGGMLTAVHNYDLTEGWPSRAALVVGADLGKRPAWSRWSKRALAKERLRVWSHWRKKTGS
jgi:hypothetical protein